MVLSATVPVADALAERSSGASKSVNVNVFVNAEKSKELLVYIKVDLTLVVHSC
jgi:hypothetical protein